MGFGKSCLRIYLMLLVVAFFGQRCMMYPAPKSAIFPHATRGELIVLDGDVNRRVYTYYIPAKDGLPTVVIFHGNAEQLADQLSLAEDFADVGLGVYAIEYPGYGLSACKTTGLTLPRGNSEGFS
jgi:alpha-beta hydrolase superfamily lysophospholipase